MASLPRRAAEVTEALKLVPHPEGGFFLEMFRSGSEPMETRGLTGAKDPAGLCETDRRSGEGDAGSRNWMTSIFWMPTSASPFLRLTVNKSDIVHYYQGGAPFEYVTYRAGGKVRVDVLGPDIRNGHVLQLPVEGGVWKGGRMLDDGVHDYALIGEAVGPGFDFRDFSFVTSAMLDAAPEVRDRLAAFLHDAETDLDEIDEYYDEGDLREERTAERL